MEVLLIEVIAKATNQNHRRRMMVILSTLTSWMKTPQLSTKGSEGIQAKHAAFMQQRLPRFNVNTLQLSFNLEIDNFKLEEPV